MPCYLFHAKANNKYMKGFDKNKQLLYLKYWDVNNYMDTQCYKNCL